MRNIKNTLLAAFACSLSASAVASTAHAEPLHRIDDGTWMTFVGADGITASYDINMWVDLYVPNLSTSKWVGIVWTEDDWQTVRWAYGTREATYDNGDELWGVDITPTGTLTAHRSIGPIRWMNREGVRRDIQGRQVVLEYAVFYQHPSGTMYWDNNGGANYRLILVENH